MKTSAITRRFHASTFIGDLTISRLWTAFQVAKERRMLADLDHHALNDLGLTEADVHREANRSFWDLPSRR